MRVIDDDDRRRGRLLLPPATTPPRRRAAVRRSGAGACLCSRTGRRRRGAKRPGDAYPRSPVEARGRAPRGPQQARAARAPPHSPLPRSLSLLPVRRRRPARGPGRQGDHGRDLGWADPCTVAPFPPHAVGRMMPDHATPQYSVRVAYTCHGDSLASRRRLRTRRFIRGKGWCGGACALCLSASECM